MSVRLVDFGMATINDVASAGSRLSIERFSAKGAGGTWPYKAPEIYGTSKKPGSKACRSSDIYAFGT